MAFAYSPMFPTSGAETEWDLVTADHVENVDLGGQEFLKVAPEGLTLLAERAFKDISHLLRSGHLAQLRAILDDPEATDNDRFVALEMLKNAVIAADQVLPMCQDTGTAIVSGVRGERVLTGGGDSEALARGVYNTYQNNNLRFSQLAPLSMFEEVNTKTNLPAQIDIDSGASCEKRRLLFW